MKNNNYAKNHAQRLGDNVERVIWDNLEISVALKNPPYIETSEDRPNFYSEWLFNKQTALTKEEYIQGEINKYETNVLNLKPVSKKCFNTSYIIDNKAAVFNIEATALSKELGITLSDLYNLNYMKVKNTDTNEVMYFWIDSFQNNEGRKRNTLLNCTLDFWLTYYKQYVELNGDITILRNHSNRFIEKNNKLVGNFAPDSTVHNIDPEFTQLNNDIVRSLGVDTPKPVNKTQTLEINIPNNEVLFEFEISNALSNTAVETSQVVKYEDYYQAGSDTKTPEVPDDVYIDAYNVTHLKYNRTFTQGSGRIMPFTAYNKEGIFSGIDTPVRYKSTTKKGTYTLETGKTVYDNRNERRWNTTAGFTQEALLSPSTLEYDTNFYKCYLPKKYTFKQFNGDFVYVKKFDTNDGYNDAYGIEVSNVHLDDTTNVEGAPIQGANLINRIDNVKNDWLNEDLSNVINDPKADWRWAVLSETGKPIKASEFNVQEENQSILYAAEVFGTSGNSLNRITTNKTQLNLYLVDYNTRTGYGKYDTKINVGANVESVIPNMIDKVSTLLYNFDYHGNKAKDKIYTVKNNTLASLWFDSLLTLERLVQGKRVQKRYIKSIQYKAKPMIAITLNGEDSGSLFNFINSSYFSPADVYFVKKYDISNETYTLMKDKEVITSTTGSITYPISKWNKKSTIKAHFTNEIKNPKYDFFDGVSLQYKPVIYTPNSEWDYWKEPQIKMGHCIRTFFNYLDNAKQVFLELGEVENIYLNQTILPNGCIDKIYWTDKEKNYSQSELLQTNGFLEKQYDNSVPSLTDTFKSFLQNSQAQLQNSHLTATTNLDFTKRQAALNTQVHKLGLASGSIGGIYKNMGRVNRSWLGNYSEDEGVFTGGTMSKTLTGNISAATTGALSGGVGALNFGLTAASTGAYLGLAGAHRVLEGKQVALNNERMIFNAKQEVKQINAVVQDKFNQPDQLNAGSVDAQGILRRQQELSELFINSGTTGQGASFKVDTLAPNIIQLKNYSQFLHRYGYINNNIVFNTNLSKLLNRTRFNFVQIGDLQNTVNKMNLNQTAKNYVINLFNSGVRLWNLDYNNQEMLDYSKENWEINIEDKFKKN